MRSSISRIALRSLKPKVTLSPCVQLVAPTMMSSSRGFANISLVRTTNSSPPLVTCKSFSMQRASFTTESTITDEELRKRLDDFQELFVEARLCIEDVQDAVETTYFDEDAEVAQEAVDEAVANFQALLAELDEKRRGEVMRGNGLKVEQLKGELTLVLSGGH